MDSNQNKDKIDKTDITSFEKVSDALRNAYRQLSYKEGDYADTFYKWYGMDNAKVDKALEALQEAEREALRWERRVERFFS